MSHPFIIAGMMVGAFTLGATLGPTIEEQWERLLWWLNMSPPDWPPLRLDRSVPRIPPAGGFVDDTEGGVGE